MNQNKGLYWICQTVGWTTWIMVLTILAVLSRGNFQESLLLILMSNSFGFGMSHLYRQMIRRRRWVKLSLARLLPRVVVACILLAILWRVYDLSIIHYIWPQPLDYYMTYASSYLYGYLWELSVLILWSTLYFGFHYFQHYREAEVEKIMLQSTLKEAELNALKSQVNPHFLFNCLNSIRSLISESPDKAKEMTTLLSNTLRYALQTVQKRTVTLESELNVVNDYLSLEGIRLEDRLRVRTDVDPATLAAPVPPMMLQMLVENAVKHGIARLPDGGEISVSTRKNGNHLLIEVVNDGFLETKKSSLGVGLRNSISRLRAIYGDTVQFSLTDTKDGVVRAKVQIPWGGETCESLNR
jgi:signal transduction histidine kinase